MCQGVIRSLKVHYRKRIARLCIKALHKNQPLQNIQTTQAMKDIVSSWNNSVSKKTIINCFKKAGNSDSSQQLAVTVANDPFKALTEDLSNLREIDQNAFQEELSAELFIDLDNDVVTTLPISCDEDITAKISDSEKHNEIDKDINEVYRFRKTK